MFDESNLCHFHELTFTTVVTFSINFVAKSQGIISLIPIIHTNVIISCHLMSNLSRCRHGQWLHLYHCHGVTSTYCLYNLREAIDSCLLTPMLSLYSDLAFKQDADLSRCRPFPTLPLSWFDQMHRSIFWTRCMAPSAIWCRSGVDIYLCILWLHSDLWLLIVLAPVHCWQLALLGLMFCTVVIFHFLGCILYHLILRSTFYIARLGMFFKCTDAVLLLGGKATLQSPRLLILWQVVRFCRMLIFSFSGNLSFFLIISSVMCWFPCALQHVSWCLFQDSEVWWCIAAEKEKATLAISMQVICEMFRCVHATHILYCSSDHLGFGKERKFEAVLYVQCAWGLFVLMGSIVVLL